MASNPRALLLASLLATLGVAVLDAAPAGGDAYRTLPTLALTVVCLSFGHAVQLLAGNFVLAACVTLSGTWHRRAGARGLLASWLPWLGALAAVGHARAHLVAYAAFATHLPSNLGLLAAFAGAGVACSGRLGRGEPPVSAPERWLHRAVPALSLGAAAGAHVFAARLHVDDYPTLRLTLVQLGHLCLLIGLWQLARHLPARWLQRLTPVGAYALLAVVALVARDADVLAAGRPLFLARTTLGGSLASLHPYSVDDEKPRHPIPDDQEGVARFLRHAQMPKLPADFDLAHHNVLWLMAEATRFDQTSFAVRKGAANTPNLLALRQRGAYVWKRAFAPSSGTFQSLSSIFGVGLPSMLRLETWAKPWTGELLDNQQSPARLFDRAGHHTFWISHNNARCFSKTVLGMRVGFRERRFVKTSDTTDKGIADAVIETLEARARSTQPFFGFAFFVSPHAPYKRHYRELPASTPLELYRQELRFMDEQVGRVLRALDTLGLLERTIVVFAGDHGEEFRDHGGAYHRTTVYVESLNVPLIVYVPGLPGGTLEEPTSVSYVFPWLMLHGTPEMRRVAEDRMRTQFGPMLRHTGGAVVAEVLGHDRMKSTLVYPDLKVNHDFRAQRTEVYRFADDYHEQHDLFLKDPQLALDAMKRVANYKDVRASRRRFALRPDKLDPRKVPEE